MSRQDRLKHITDGPSGSSRDSLKYWSDRAEENSKIAPRAKGGEVKLPDGGTGVAWKDSHKGNMRATGKADKNHVGGTHLPNVRRVES